MLSPSGSAPFPARNSPQRLSDDAKSRSKVALKPGRSLMDWIRLGKSGKDLQGFCGKYHTVTKEELAKHNKEEDCWMAIRGKVYNITPYLEYHPGGIPEILRGVGQDGTELFDQVHKWVNVESMMASCLIGPLSASPKLKKPAKASPGRSPTKSQSSLQMPPPNGVVGMRNKKQDKPRCDWFQNDSQVFLSVYTKRADVTVDDVIVDCENRQELEVKILLGEDYFLLKKNLDHAVQCCSVKSSGNSTGKIEIALTKEEKGTRWERLGTSIDGDEAVHKEKDRELKYRKCKIKTIKEVTHDTHLFGIELPERVIYSSPIGHHCLFKMTVEGMDIDRSYTSATKSLLQQEEELPEESRVLYFMIKIYEDGVFTSRLGKLRAGDTVIMSDCTGDFKLSRLHTCRNIYLVAAGTGLTPMLRIILYCLYKRKDTKIKMLFANKSEKDILWQSSLDRLEAEHERRFSITYILSRPSSSWTGLKGRIDKQIVSDLLVDFGPEEDDSSLCCICGPTDFTNSVERMMIDNQVSKRSIHCFLG